MWSRTTRPLAAAGLILALALGPAACGGDDGESGDGGEPSLHVGISFTPGLDDTADRVAFERLERRTGMKLQLTESGGPANTAAGVLRGDFDLGATSLLSAVNAIDNGADLEVILGSAMAVDFFLLGGEGVDSLDDLEGGKVGHGEPGGASATLAQVAIDRAGVDAEAMVVDDAGSRVAALLSGRLEGAVLEYPDMAVVTAQEEGLTELASLYDLAPFLMADVWIVRGAYARKHREEVQRFVTGMLDGYEFVRTPAGRRAWLDEARPYAEEDEGGTELLDDIYERADRTGYWPERERPVDRARHDRSIAFWREAGLVESDVPYEEVWNISFWRAAS